MPWVRPVCGPGRPPGGALRKEAGAVGVPVGKGQDLVQALMGAAWWLGEGGHTAKAGAETLAQGAAQVQLGACGAGPSLGRGHREGSSGFW